MIELLQGDCIEVMRDMPDASYTACLCDPPYGLKFMGKRWDHGVPGVEYWAEALRVLKPGAVLMAFGGTRTFHRLACAIEDAGFEIADTIMWVYGSGFPKSHDMSKGIDKAAGAEREVTGEYTCPDGRPRQWGIHRTKRNGIYSDIKTDGSPNNRSLTAPATPDAATWSGWGTALKPAWEPIIVARKPRGSLTYAECAVRYGSGALWIDGGRVATNGGSPAAQHRMGKPSGRPGEYGDGHAIVSRTTPERYAEPRIGEAIGRWPANLIHDGSDEATAGMPETTSGGGNGERADLPNICMSGRNYARTTTDGQPPSSGYAARYFYCAKASRAERDAGLDARDLVAAGGLSGRHDGGLGSITMRKNNHPTIKPLALTEYLAKLLRPPEAYLDDAALLVPFAGVGSEMIGAVKAGWRNVTGIELSAEYAELGRARLAHWQAQCAPQLELFEMATP